MPQQLTTQNATITTATIQIQMLTIGRKQVTLAVFRQLREEPLVADDGTLNGVPWGFVNYHPDRCGEARDHWHIVWQRGSELLRSHVTTVPDFDYITPHGSRHPAHWYSSKAIDRYLTAVVYAGLKAGGDSVLEASPRPAGIYWDETYSPDSYMAKLVFPAALAGTDEFPVSATASQAAVTAADLAARSRVEQTTVDKEFSDYERGRSPEWQAGIRASRQKAAEEARGKYLDAMETLRNLIETWGGFDAISGAYTAEIEAEETRRRQQLAVRTTLAQLPQLFIAV